MGRPIVKIKNITIENVKNVLSGTICVKSDSCSEEVSSDILGVYGQNGSGKSTLIDSLDILKTYLSGKSIPKNFEQQITIGKSEANFKYEFLVCDNETPYEVELEFKLARDEFSVLKVIDETLKFKSVKHKISQRTIIDTKGNSNTMPFKPEVRFKEVINKQKNQLVDLIVAKELATEKRQSYIFSSKTQAALSNAFSEKIYFEIIKALHDFGRVNLLVVSNKAFGAINLSYTIPFYLKIGDISGMLSLNFNESKVPHKNMDIYNALIKQLNILIKTIIPGMEIVSKIISEDIDKKNEVEYKVQLLSVRNGVEIPIKYESDGITKILSILSALTALYNNKDVFVAIDELDSGIFEYLLGEFLAVMKETGKGQLVFTSHNLRPLEILDKEKIYFTTTNPLNRYIRFKNLKPNHNLRDVYLRAIQLGGQPETVYEETKEYEISRAFRIAGKK